MGRHWWWLLGVCFPVGVLPYWCAGVGCQRLCVGCVLTDNGVFLLFPGPWGACGLCIELGPWCACRIFRGFSC